MFTSLTLLKDWLLPESLRADYKWNDVITAIGQGVSSSFDSYTNRALEYAVGKADVFKASLTAFALSCYPVVTVTKFETRGSLSDGWTVGVVNDSIYSLDETSGLVEFMSANGTSQEQVRLTYTGGYWAASTKYPTLPTGATAMPSDLMLAYRAQCELAWNQKDKLGGNILVTTQEQKPYTWSDHALLDGVQDVLKRYIRYQIL
jgi:hypothetical protein